jgi:hypothetical protein
MACHSIVISESKAEWKLFYALEYYTLDADGDKRRLRSDIHHEPSMTHAISYARAVLKYVLMQDQKPDHCLVKDPSGKVLTVVSRVASLTSDPSSSAVVNALQAP